MAPLCDVARIKNKSLVLQAAKGMAKEQLERQAKQRKEEKARKKQLQAHLFNLRIINKDLTSVDREIAKCIRDGKTVSSDLAHERRELKEIKAWLATQIRKARR